MSDAADTDYVPVETVYAGRRITADNKPVFVFYLLGSEEKLTFHDNKAFKKFRSAVIGGVYVHQRRGDGDTFRLSETFTRTDNDPRIVGWRAADDAFDVAERARKRISAERAKSKQGLLSVLAPFREEYAKTDYVGRLALEVVILHVLRGRS